ncbi:MULTISPECIES: GNAT family N-acetyltransferase [Xanthobacter]|uniref:GNAT family N-acetyltransferase n=1 Tax=Xanthobacter TaxID=279 RepID=UPI001F4370D3|nr:MULTISPECIES: GNAT family N-acetyltransferase [unclassified Xanthobacter]
MTIVEPPHERPLAESSIPVLETDRLVLRAPRIEDAYAVAELANNRKIAEMTANLPFPYRASDAHAFVESLGATPHAATFALLLKREGHLEFAGMCGFGRRPGETLPELGYWVGEPFWGLGIATEAARAVIDYVFSQTDIEALSGAARVVNPASRRVLEKCGFQWCGVGLCQVRALGASVPVDRFQLDRRTWASLRAWGSTLLPHLRAATH